MFSFAVFAALISLSVATTVDHCLGGPLPNAVRIQGCEISPCKVAQGEELHMQVDFALKKPAEKITARVLASALGSMWDYALSDAKRNVCNNLVGGASCPLSVNEAATYELDLPVDLPVTYNLLRVYLEDETGALINCFAFQGNVVDA